MKEFHDWCARESARIEGELRLAAMAGDMSRQVYFVPASVGQWARLVLAHEKPPEATEPIRFPSYGTMTTRVAAIPYRDIAAGLRDACARLPVYPA